MYVRKISPGTDLQQSVCLYNKYGKHCSADKTNNIAKQKALCISSHTYKTN